MCATSNKSKHSKPIKEFTISRTEHLRLMFIGDFNESDLEDSSDEDESEDSKESHST